MRVAAIDYRIHYLSATQSMSQWDWAARHLDNVVGGTMNQYKIRNPTMRHATYDLIWAPRQKDVGPMEKWLTSKGYRMENAYLHRAGTSKTRANRVTFTVWGSARYATNPGNPGFRAWRAYRTRQLTALNNAGRRSDAVFFDEMGSGGIQGRVPAKTLEYSTRAAYNTALETLLAQHRAWTPSGLAFLNTASYRKALDVIRITAAGGSVTEQTNSPYQVASQIWRHIDGMLAKGAIMQFTTGVPGGSKNNGRPSMNAGNYGSIAERVLIWEYASYLMVVQPALMNNLYFDPYGVTTRAMSLDWLAAFEVDIGLARAPRSIWKQGTDGTGQTYDIWKREFDNALVLIRPVKGWGDSKFGDNTAVTVALPAGTWRMLRPNGTVTAAVKSVRLRNAEAAIFVK
jgi:hypothetical protein